MKFDKAWTIKIFNITVLLTNPKWKKNCCANVSFGDILIILQGTRIEISLILSRHEILGVLALHFTAL